MALQPFTIEHFEQYAALMVFDDDRCRGLEDWQLELAEDLFRGFKRNLWILPEGNGKTTFTSILALYGADYSESPWITVAAASAKQARIMHDQATGFIERTPGMKRRFKSFGGYLLIRSLKNGGRGIDIFAHDPKTGDGVIPYPFAICDELHRYPDMQLWDLWGGKLRKRDGQLIGISTAGEPETPFENMRESIRLRADKRDRDGSHLRCQAPDEILHEWMVPSDDECTDMAAVKAANPLQTITEATLTADFALVTNLNDWKRLKCNRPARQVQSAITDKEWDDAYVKAEPPKGATVDVGLDWAPKWDTTALVGCWSGPAYRLLAPVRVIVPPRDGSSIHPDEVKFALEDLAAGYTLGDVVMDMSKAHDIAAWIEDNMGVRVIDRAQTPKFQCLDYQAFTAALRNGEVKHNGDRSLRAHALNAIARRLPGGDYVFSRPNESRGAARMQDQRVIDALTAAAMVVEHTGQKPPKRSVYEDRSVIAA